MKVLKINKDKKEVVDEDDIEIIAYIEKSNKVDYEKLNKLIKKAEVEGWI